MERILPVVLGLFSVWLLLSGMLEVLVLGLGIASAALVAWIATRMDRTDRAGTPLRLHFPRVGRYWWWLGIEVVKSNWDVTRRILSPNLPIDPVVRRYPLTQRTDLGRVIYANSITLTPGTVSIDLDADGVEVHALTRESADWLADGDMDRRVTELERG